MKIFLQNLNFPITPTVIGSAVPLTSVKDQKRLLEVSVGGDITNTANIFVARSDGNGDPVGDFATIAPGKAANFNVKDTAELLVYAAVTTEIASCVIHSYQ